MKKLINFIVICIFWIVIYLIFSFLIRFFNIGGINSFLIGLIISLFVISIIYTKNWYRKLIRKKSGALVVASLVVLSATFIGYSHSIVKRSLKLYTYMTSDNVRGWEGKAHIPDSIYGFKPFKNARAFHVFPIGEPIPMAYDRDGFRVPLKDTLKVNIKDSVDIIYFGCSFTYGDACYADSTFAHLTAKELDFNYINAGVCSYGLSQMYLLAKDLVPKYKPKYVVFQYGDWLLTRALSINAPVYYGSLPVPCFIKKGNKFEIRTPFYQTQIFDIDKADIYKNFHNKFFKFLLVKGIPFYFKEDINRLSAFINRAESPTDDPKNELELSKQIYAELIQISLKNNAQPIILILGNEKKSNELDRSFIKSLNGAYLADAVKEQYDFLNQHSLLDASKAFCHWRINNEGDSILVDNHPNNLSHRIISKTIIKTITK